MARSVSSEKTKCTCNGATDNDFGCCWPFDVLIVVAHCGIVTCNKQQIILGQTPNANKTSVTKRNPQERTLQSQILVQPQVLCARQLGEATREHWWMSCV